MPPITRSFVMSKTVFKGFLAVACLLAPPPVLAQSLQECTAAVFSPAAAEGHRPMLWKNRDTGELSNRVVYVKELPHSYLAVVDKDDPTGRVCWAGLNDAGFGIMNTASYNLPQKKGEQTDGEGLIMAQALRTCRTVADFEAFLKANLGPNLGAATNFGVIDSEGSALLLEVHNHGVVRYEAEAAPSKFLFVTNYSRSGTSTEGSGRIRMDRVLELDHLRRSGPYSPLEIFRDFARDTGHPLVKSTTWSQFHALKAQSHWVHTRHTINRWDTACSIVLVGKDPTRPDTRPMMWILPGEPLVSIALPLWVDAGNPPSVFFQGKEAPLWTETLRLKALARPGYGAPEKQEYLDAARLDNQAGTGFLPTLLKAEASIFECVKAFETTPHTPAERSALQAELANQAMATLRAVR